MSNIIDKSFGLNLKVLRVLRLFSPNPPTFLFKAQAFVLYFAFIWLVSMLMVVNLVLGEDFEAMEVNVNAGIMGETVCYITKLLPFFTKKIQMRNCLYYFADSRFSSFQDERKDIVEECVKTCRRNSAAFAVVITTAATFLCIRPIFRKGCALPVDVWLPFDMTNSLTYYSTYALLSIATVYTAGCAIMDPLIGGLACHAACQLRVLKYSLQHLGENTTVGSIHEEIAECVQHHNAILNFVDQFEEVFSSVVFSQLMMSAFVIGFFILQLGMMQELSVNLMVSVVAIGGVSVQIYFYCYYGTILYEESFSISDAICMGRWYEYDLESQTALLILMERSKKPIVVTAGKILNLSLDTFAMILRRSYSLLAVLKNYQ